MNISTGSGDSPCRNATHSSVPDMLGFVAAGAMGACGIVHIADVLDCCRWCSIAAAVRIGCATSG
jgi:hypothetical protein